MRPRRIFSYSESWYSGSSAIFLVFLLVFVCCCKSKLYADGRDPTIRTFGADIQCAIWPSYQRAARRRRRRAPPPLAAAPLDTCILSRSPIASLLACATRARLELQNDVLL
jgi:hypothetical protein